MKVGAIVRITEWGNNRDGVLWWAVTTIETTSRSEHPDAVRFHAKVFLVEHGSPMNHTIAVYHPPELGPAGAARVPAYTFPPDEEVPDRVWAALATRTLVGKAHHE